MATTSKRGSALNLVLGFGLVGLMFAAAGTFVWPALWVLLGSYFLAMSAWLIWLRRRDPDLLKERMTGRTKPDAKGWDRTILRAYAAALAVMLIVAPLDAVRFRWSHVPRTLQGAALAGLGAAWFLLMRVFQENRFLSEVVRIQTDRGHAVCTTGPYRIVRHPMYVAIIVTVLLVPILLGSLYALIPAALVVALFVLRTAFEDKTLRAELPGYADYAARVRWKLVPHVW